ncbi:sodium:solute symporter family domain-containing protein [Ditylenchus destructor]|nr:sodium:solute symporter family domain-containing protein [Ditylenchus destructor]
MDFFNGAIFVAILVLISLYGVFRYRTSKPTKPTSEDLLVGSNVSVFSVALSLCSSYISAISVLGFPSEVYYRGSMIAWFGVMYCIAFPVVAFVFLPVFYNLRHASLYEYLEKRFCFSCRIISSLLFVTQMLFYLSVAVYAPALALSAAFHIPTFAAILLTAFISAFYLYLGGASVGIHTSALQMTLILGSLVIICSASLFHWNANLIYSNLENGKRFDFNDFRIDPRVRHSLFSLLIGGSGTIFSLFATNQIAMQRYMALPTLKQAQKVALLNIPMNCALLCAYLVSGYIIYGVLHGCHPKSVEKDKIFPYFVETQLNWMPGVEGLFLAALYSAGISTLTALYNALTTVTIEDIIKPLVSKFATAKQLSPANRTAFATYLPFFFGVVGFSTAFFVARWDMMILQLSLSIFGSMGGASLGIFCIGLFCPWITSKAAALFGQIASILACFFIVIGSVTNEVKPVNFPLSSECLHNSTSAFIIERSDMYGTVKSINKYGSFLSAVTEVSYQYYSICGVSVCVLVSHCVQLFINFLPNRQAPNGMSIDPALLAFRSNHNRKDLNEIDLNGQLLPHSSQ